MKKKIVDLSRKALAAVTAPTQVQIRCMLFAFGIVLLGSGLALDSIAGGLQTNYNDVRISGSVNAILTYLEGSFGVLVMVCAGLGAIISSAFGQYRAALGLLVVAVGAFILRSLVGTFFNDRTIRA